MILPEKVRIKIADRMVRTMVPVMLICMTFATISLILWGNEQYHRLITILFAMIAMIPAWVFTVKGKPLIGANIIFILLIVVILLSMTFSGGIRAPAYIASLSMLSAVIVLHGTRGGIICFLAIIIIGGVFVWLDSMAMIPKVNQPPAVFFLLIFSTYLIIQAYFILIPVRLIISALLNSQNAIIELESTQEKLQSILDKTPDIIYRLDPDGNIIFINDAIKVYGYEPEFFIGKPLAEFLHPDEVSDVKTRIFERKTKAYSLVDFEIQLRLNKETSKSKHHSKRNMGWSTFLISSSAFYDQEEASIDSFIGTQGIARDITDKKVYEKQLAMFGTVIEQAHEEVVITDVGGVIEYVNPSFEKNTGYNKTEIIGKKPFILNSGIHEPSFYKNLWTTILDKKIWKGLIHNKCKDGNILLHDMVITPILNSKNQISAFVSIRRDITGKTKLEQQIRQSQKMEAIGTLAGGIAHDFNNILSGILGYSELAQSNINNSEKALNDISNIIKAAERATELVQQILTFSRQAEYKTRPLKIDLDVNEALKLLRSSIPSTIEIKKRLNSKSLILADPSKIHQVVMNLCTNAYHAMRKTGGILTVSLKDTVLSGSKELKGKKVPPGKYLSLEISDTGHGMNKKTLEKAFDPYYTSKKVGQGTGLGLPIVQAIVDEHDGFLEVYSSPDKGTNFYLYFPIVEKRIETQKIKPQKTSQLKGNETVMLVDDEKSIRDSCEELLKIYGYKVSAFENGLDALTEFQKKPSKYDLIITDLTMPKMTGDKLAIELLKINSNIPVFLCTGHSQNISEEQAELIGIEHLLMKPVQVEDLIKKIREALDKKT